MKWSSKQLQAFLNKPSGDWPHLVLVYGEDGGQVREYARHIACQIVSDLDDPFLSDRLRVEDLLESPSSLSDSAGTMSFGGGLRLVRLEGVNSSLQKNQMDKVVEAVKSCLAQPYESSVVLISAPGVEATSALAKAVEKDKKAVAIRCFQDGAQDLRSVIQNFFKEHSKTVSPDAMQFLLDNLGSDRDITRRELEKLLLYVGRETGISLQSCLESIASAPSMNVFKLCDAIGNRNASQADVCLKALTDEGADLTMISALALRHLRRLLEARELMGQGLSADQAMMKLKPPVFYGKQDFSAQLRRYPLGRLKKISERFYDLQLQSRQGVLSVELVLERGLLGLSL